MPKVKIYNREGQAVGEKSLSDAVFGVAVKPHLVHEVLVNLLASARRPWAHTKTRGEVSGGGKKPWKQKGTGRARHGSIRSPLWVGGGITFGPRSERTYAKKTNKTAQRRALLMALSDKVADNRLVLVDSLVSAKGKTKEAAALFAKLPVKGKLAVIPAERDELLKRSLRNLPNVSFCGLGDLNLKDVLGADYLIMAAAAADKLEAKYGQKS